jgi:hypothetical protein
MRLGLILPLAARFAFGFSKSIDVGLLESGSVWGQALPNETFIFDAPFGSNMVLQYGTQAAVYGYARARGVVVLLVVVVAYMLSLKLLLRRFSVYCPVTWTFRQLLSP